MFRRSLTVAWTIGVALSLGVVGCGPGGNGNGNANENGGGVEGVFYVSAVRGDDAGPGTDASPWRTIQQAAETLEAGQTVYIMAGTYAEQVIPRNSGSDGSPIVYAAVPGDAVTLDGEGITLSKEDPEDMGGLIHISDLSYITVSGLRIINAGPGDNDAGILVERSNYIIIENNTTYNTASSGIGVWNCNHITIDGNEVELACNDGEQECISVAGTDTFEIRNNHIHDNGPGTIGGEGICPKDGSSNGRVFNNHVHDLNVRVGIYIDAWDKHTFNIEVFRNRVHDIAGADGLMFASEQGGLLENIRVYNNIAYQNGCSGVSVSVGNEDPNVASHPLRDIYVINNTLYSNGSDACFGATWGGGISVDNPDVENVVIRNNICSQNMLFQILIEGNVPAASLASDHNLIDGFRDELAGETRGDSYVEGDPLFADAAGGDFRVGQASPAIDQGSSTEAPADDFDSSVRPQGAKPDIGAFESPSP